LSCFCSFHINGRLKDVFKYTLFLFVSFEDCRGFNGRRECYSTSPATNSERAWTKRGKRDVVKTMLYSQVRL